MAWWLTKLFNSKIDTLLTKSQARYRGETGIGIPPVSKLVMIFTSFLLIASIHPAVTIWLLLVIN